MTKFTIPRGTLPIPIIPIIGGKARPIVPIHYISDGKCSCGDKRCENPGKHPVSYWKGEPVAPNGVKSATTDAKLVAEWLKLFGERPFNWAVATAGLVVIDVDPRNGGTESGQRLAGELGVETVTPGYKVETPGGGSHGYWLKPAGVKIKNDSKGGLGPGLDIKTDGGYVLIPPSVGPNGKGYTAVGAPVDAFDLPAALAIKLIAPKAAQQGTDATESGGGTPSFDLAAWLFKHSVPVLNEIDWPGDGERNPATVYEVECPFSPEDPHNGTPARVWQDRVTGVLYATCHHGRCQGKATWRNFRAIYEPGYDPNREYETPSDAPSQDGSDPNKLDEQEYRDLFLSRAEGRLVRGLGGYLEYKRGFWERGDAMLAERHAQEALTGIGAKVVVSKVERMVRLARPYLAVPDERWDHEPYKLVLKNGTLDLESRRLEAHSPDNYITAAVPYAFDPDAKGPNWDVVTGHIKYTLGQDVHDFLQAFYGYALTADTSHELMVFLTGEPGCGKSTFEVGGETMLGPMLYTSLSIKRIQERFGRAKVVGKRLIVSPELPPMYLFETEMIDALISGETIEIEEKNKPQYDYAPVAKVIQACNDLPVVSNPRQGFNRRVAIVEFPALAASDKRKDLKDAIRCEGPYILNWALEGWARLRERGEFDIPEAVEAATNKWKQDNDTVSAFVKECLTEGIYTIRRARILELYSRWCETNNLKPLGRRKFYESFTKTPFHKNHHAVVDGYDVLKAIDLTDEGTHINSKGYNAAINFAEL